MKVVLPWEPYSLLRGVSGIRDPGSGLWGNSKLEFDLWRAIPRPTRLIGPPLLDPPFTGRLAIISSFCNNNSKL